MDSAQFQKLKDYVNLLVKQGEACEKDKEYGLAIEKFLKVVDVLLIMADSSPNYPLWVQCTDKAQAFQKKIKNLIALASIEAEKEGSHDSIASPVEKAPISSLPQRASSF